MIALTREKIRNIFIFNIYGLRDSSLSFSIFVFKVNKI